MDLNSQIQTLVKEAPNDGVTSDAVIAIAPALKAIASQLKHPQYYILQTLDQSWVMTSLSQRTQPEVRKNIIYAFPTLKDVEAGPHPVKDPQIMALPIPVTHILFQMLAMKPIDSIIFFDIPGNLNQGIEIRQEEVKKLVQIHLKKASNGSQIPSDLA